MIDFCGLAGVFMVVTVLVLPSCECVAFVCSCSVPILDCCLIMEDGEVLEFETSRIV